MANSSQIPASELIRGGTGLGDVQEARKTKDAYRKQKDLEEERKLGIAPAMVDVETGRDINPHIPEFIAKNPWYVPSSGPTLQHQRPHPERQVHMSTIDEWYKRGPTNKVASKYRKGACENCGAMTHKKKDCFERPRKLEARWTGEDIAPDEYMQPDLKLGWDAKRDRWNGYDPATHQQVVEEYERVEQTRKQIREEKMKEGKEVDSAAEDSAEGKEEQLADEDMYADDADMAGVTVDMDSRTRITVRNLRIREDTAKYLYNLDPNGPYYDPKSRSMHENPFASLPGKEKEAAKFAGENFVRYTGEVVEANEAQVFAWQARCKGIDVHALAEPTKLEAMKREYEKQKVDSKQEHKEKLLEKYGGEEHLDAPPKELLLAQTENYVEYSRKGKVIKGEDRPVVRSRYEEDKYINNHTAVWGSYWRDGRWGYACCHSFVKLSYCIGKIGHEVSKELPLHPTVSVKKEEPHDEEPSTSSIEKTKNAAESTERSNGSPSDESTSESDSSSESSAEDSHDSEKERELEKEKQKEAERKEREDKRREKKREKRKRQKEKKGKDKKKKGRSKKKSSSESESSSEDDTEKNDEDLKKAIAKAKKEWREGEKAVIEGDRKRKYHSKYEVTAPTETDMEAYHMTQLHWADPMSGYMTEKRRRGDD